MAALLPRHRRVKGCIESGSLTESEEGDMNSANRDPVARAATEPGPRTRRESVAAERHGPKKFSEPEYRLRSIRPSLHRSLLAFRQTVGAKGLSLRCDTVPYISDLPLADPHACEWSHSLHNIALLCNSSAIP